MLGLYIKLSVIIHLENYTIGLMMHRHSYLISGEKGLIVNNDTHKLIGATAAAGACVLTTPPLIACGVIIGTAWYFSPGPDRLEHPLPISLKLERKIEHSFGIKLHFKHRGWTHWLLVGLIISMALGAIIGLLGVGIIAFILDAISSLPIHIHEPSKKTISDLGQAAGIGAMIGYGMHSIADAMTCQGSKLLGPFYRKPIHLLPRSLRITTGGAGERLIQILTCGFVVWLAYQQVAGVS
jgi:membrane-bound metal-dependent hydrolase YbcI (DUF457 family)